MPGARCPPCAACPICPSQAALQVSSKWHLKHFCFIRCKAARDVPRSLLQLPAAVDIAVELKQLPAGGEAPPLPPAPDHPNSGLHTPAVPAQESRVIHQTVQFRVPARQCRKRAGTLLSTRYLSKSSCRASPSFHTFVPSSYDRRLHRSDPRHHGALNFRSLCARRTAPRAASGYCES